MTNLNNMLKNKNIILSTKVLIIKAMVFLVVVYSVRDGKYNRQSTKEFMTLNSGAGEGSSESLGK